MSFFSFFRRKPTPTPKQVPAPPKDWSLVPSAPTGELDIRRHFYNEHGFQCYASFFAHWGGWITAGHCMTETNDLLPPFAQTDVKGDFKTWPEGLDAAILGCKLPVKRPSNPVIGQAVICKGFPAGSRNLETRTGKVYFERNPGTWIAHIEDPDEPVVTGMSGGPVIDIDTGEPIGVIITRNSPADLNNDRDPDESCDFISLAAVWDAVMIANRIA